MLEELLRLEHIQRRFQVTIEYHAGRCMYLLHFGDAALVPNSEVS